MEIGEASTMDIYGLINQAIGSLEQGNSEDIKASKISVKANKKSIEEKRQERLDKILSNLGRLSHGKCLGVFKLIVNAFAVVTAPFPGVSAALGLGGILLNGLDRLQQAKNQKNYLLSQEDAAILKRVIEEVKKLFDDELGVLKQGDEQQERELVQMKQAIEEATLNKEIL